MASLAEREGLRGKAQCVYFDPPYGIKFNSNFQWSTTSRDVKDGDRSHVTREPEQVRAFRDTWKDGIHSYLTYLRDRLTVARDLLNESGSIFVQIGDENVHRLRALMDEVFGEDNYVSTIVVSKTSSATARFLAVVNDSIVWFAKDSTKTKYRQMLKTKQFGEDGAAEYTQVLLENGEMRAQTIDEKEDCSHCQKARGHIDQTTCPRRVEVRALFSIIVAKARALGQALAVGKLTSPAWIG
jgi:adenine-specific DNA-methyltransferase